MYGKINFFFLYLQFKWWKYDEILYIRSRLRQLAAFNFSQIFNGAMALDLWIVLGAPVV